jgi:hypothetical protein
MGKLIILKEIKCFCSGVKWFFLLIPKISFIILKNIALILLKIDLMQKRITIAWIVQRGIRERRGIFVWKLVRTIVELYWDANEGNKSPKMRFIKY